MLGSSGVFTKKRLGLRLTGGRGDDMMTRLRLDLRRINIHGRDTSAAEYVHGNYVSKADDAVAAAAI